MADALDQSTGSAVDASAEAPVAAETPDLEATIVAPLIKKFDERFSGFQSIYDQKLAGVTRAISDLKTAGLSPEEQEQVRTDAAAEENQRLVVENALLRFAQKGPAEAKAVAEFQKITAGQSLEDQLAAIMAAGQAEQAVATAAEETVDETADSTAAPPSGTPPNPARTKGPTLAGYNDGDKMTSEMKDAIFAAVGNEKGALFKARQG